MCRFEPFCHPTVSGSLWWKATWRSKMVANGSRSVTKTGPSLTAEWSVACLASPGRGSTIPESTSEYVWSWVVQRAEQSLNFKWLKGTYIEIQDIKRYVRIMWLLFQCCDSVGVLLGTKKKMHLQETGWQMANPNFFFLFFSVPQIGNYIFSKLPSVPHMDEKYI